MVRQTTASSGIDACPHTRSVVLGARNTPAGRVMDDYFLPAQAHVRSSSRFSIMAMTALAYDNVHQR